jgi:hypothetical protein
MGEVKKMAKLTAKKTTKKSAFAQHGWKKVHTSSTGTLYMSALPAQIVKSMAEANMRDRILSTGLNLDRFTNRNNGEILAKDAAIGKKA